MIRYLLLFALAVHACAATLSERIDRAIAASPAAQSAFWGIKVVDLADGMVVYERNPHSFLVPASNTKLFTTALALTRLGPDYSYRTSVLAPAAPDDQGTIHGSLRLVGGGDPNLSPRPLPYKPGNYEGDPLVAIEELADQVAARGVKRVDGDIVGDDTRYTWEPYAGGWAVGDPVYEYGTAVSALTVNDNFQNIVATPGSREGDPAAIELQPAIEYYHIDNRVVTTAAGSARRIEFERVPGSMELKVWGTMPLRNTGLTFSAGIEDPAEFAALALRQALEQRGIVVTGRAVADHQMPNTVPDLTKAEATAARFGIELAVHVSAPLVEDLQLTDKVSQNLHAEMTLRAVGAARRNIGSREAGLEELKAFLTEIGVADDAWQIHDGSGLSRNNLVTPDTVVRLLRSMYASPQRDNWISLLPVGGQDGTLKNRFPDAAIGARVHAKTGSVAHVSALSGYIAKTGGGWYAFSILVNNFNAPTSEITKVMDRICALIMEK